MFVWYQRVVITFCYYFANYFSVEEKNREYDGNLALPLLYCQALSLVVFANHSIQQEDEWNEYTQRYMYIFAVYRNV